MNAANPMFATDSSASRSAGASAPETALTVALALCLLFSQVSISVVQIFLGCALALWIYLLIRKKRRFAAPGYFWPLLVYVALSLVSSAFSVNPGLSFKDSKELLLYILIPIVLTAFTRLRDFGVLSWALLTSGLANGLYSIGYEIVKAKPAERVKGFMGHYMTQAGLLVLFSSVALGFIFFSKGKKRLVWAAGFVLASAALGLTFTRSGWIGLAVALGVILLLWKPKALILVPVLAALVFLAGPRAIRERAASIFSLRDPSNIERIEYFRAGIRIIRDFPLLGTGPDTVDLVFQNPKYGLDVRARHNVHLHSDIMQIGAERGIAALLAWLAFVITAFVSLARLVKKKDFEIFPFATAALAALAAFFVAGFFEYNFGDSEIATLLLFIVTLPFAIERISASGPAPKTLEPGSRAAGPEKTS
jgi:O-antigen ligase